MIAQALAAACIAASSCSSHAQAAFRPLVSGLDAPTYVTAAPGDPPGRLYVTEQPGRVVVIDGGRVSGTLLDIRSLVKSGGEQGLLSIAFSPGYATNRRFYVSYTDTDGNSRVVEYRSNGTQALAGSARQLLFVRQPYANHNGGQLQFDSQGYLYFGLGDGGSEDDPLQTSENLATRLGKLVRINPARSGSTWEVIGYGLRNPWRFSFDRATGDLWIGDVGQNTWEEVDYRPRSRIGKLANYGWSRYEGRAIFDTAHRLGRRGQLVFPTWVYRHVGGSCSITGGYVYRGASVPGDRGRYFFGDYCSGRVWSFRVGNGRASTARVEPSAIPSLSSFGEDNQGELFATSLDGTLYRLRP